MAENIDDLYSELTSDPRFKSMFESQAEFEQYLANEPTANMKMENIFGVQSASEYLKKKDQPLIQNLGKESSSSPSLSVGQTEEVVAQPPASGEQNLGIVETEPAAQQNLLGVGTNVPGQENLFAAPEPLGYGKAMGVGPQTTKPPGKNPSDVLKSTGKLRWDKEGNGIWNQQMRPLYNDIINLAQNPNTSSFELDKKLKQYVDLYKQIEPTDNVKEDFNTLVKTIKSSRTLDAVVSADGVKVQKKEAKGFLKEEPLRIGTFIEPKKSGVFDTKKLLEQQNTPAPPSEKEKGIIDYLDAYDRYTNPSNYQFAALTDPSRAGEAFDDPEYLKTLVTEQETKVDKTVEGDVNSFIKNLRSNVSPDAFDAPGLVSQTTSVWDADLKKFIQKSEKVQNSKRRLQSEYGLYALDDANNFIVNPVYLENEVDKLLNSPTGPITDKVVKSFNDKRKMGGLDPYTREEVVKIFKPRFMRLAKVAAQQKLDTDLVDRRLMNIDVFKEDVERTNIDLNADIQNLTKNTQKLVNDFNIKLADNVKSEAESLATAAKVSNENAYAQYSQIVKTTPLSVEQQAAEYQKYVDFVSQNATAYEEQTNALKKKAEQDFLNYKLQIENTAKSDLDKIKKKYGIISDKDEKGQMTTAMYRKYRDAYKKAYDDIKTEEQQNSDAMGYRLTDILQTSSARVFGNTIEAVSAAVGYEDNPLTDLLKYLDAVQAKSKVNIKPFSKVLDEEGLFSAEGFKSLVQNTVQQAPNLTMGIAAGVLSQNPFVAGGIMFGIETTDQVGQNYKESYEKFGSIARAEDAAAETFRTQVLISPLYTIQMLPFTKGFLSKVTPGTGVLGFGKKFAFGTSLEMLEETGVEIAQNYLNYKFTNDNPVNFSTWVSQNGLNTSLDVLPSVAVLGGSSALMENYRERQTEMAKGRVLNTLGRLGMSQTIADAVQVIGDKGVMVVPEYLYRTGQINAEELKDMRLAFQEVVKALPNARTLVQDQDAQKYFVSLSTDRALFQKKLDESKDEFQKKLIEEKIKSIDKKLGDVAAGKPLQLTKIKFKDGSSIVVSNDEMTNQYLKNEQMMENLTSEGITVETQDPAITKAIEEKKKSNEKELQEATDKGAKQLGGVQTIARDKGATMEEQDKLNEVAAKATSRGQANTNLILNEAVTLQRALEQVAPGARIVFMNNEEFNEVVPQLGGKRESAGNFAYRKNEDGSYSVEVQINLDKANSTTLAHEIGHVVLLRTLGSDPKLFNEMRTKLRKTIEGTVKNDVLRTIDALVNQYKTNEQAEEFLVELTSTLRLNAQKLEISTLEKIAKVISDFVAYVTGGQVQIFNEIQTRADFTEFINGMTETLRTGEIAKPLQRKIDAVQEQEAGQVPVQPEAGVSQEVAEGAPQTEPQVAAEQGKEEVTSPLSPEEQAIKQEEIADFVENADETNPGIAVPVNPNQTFNKIQSKSQLGVYEDAIFNGESFSNPLPTKTLKEIAKEYDGRLFIITSDGTGYGLDSEGNPIFGGFGFLTHPKNQEDGVGFASVDVSTVKSTITRIRNIYGNEKVGVLVMVQPPYTTINNSYGTQYFARSMKQLAANPQQLLEAKNSFKQWVLGNKEASRILKKEDIKKGKRNTLSALFNLIDSIDANTDVNEFTKEFLKDTTFDSRKLIFQGLIPDRPNLKLNKNTPAFKRLFSENGFNTESFLREYGDKTFLTDELITQDKGGFVVGGFEIDIKPEKEMLGEIEALQSKGFEHPLFNGKLPGTNHFALDGLYGVNENFAKFNKPQRVFDFEKIAELFKNENLIPTEKPKKISEREEGRKYADDKVNELVRENYKNETDYEPAAVEKVKEKFPPNKKLNFEKDILPDLGYTNLKSAKKIEFKTEIGESMGILMDQTADVATDVARGTGFQPTEVGKEQLKTTEFAKPWENSPQNLKMADENFGTEDGKANFQSKAQYSPKELSTLSETISNRFDEAQLENLKGMINQGVTAPQNTTKAYKLFKVKKNFPGELFPLFVGANESVTTGDWIAAKVGELTQTKEGKTMVKSTLGPLAFRPGWHSGDIAVATHIGAKKNASDKAPTLRADDQVWAEVEVGNDVDWQTEANNRAEKTKDGKILPRTAHITDQVPSGGNYKYKTNSNMTGSWIISGEMKVNRILTDAEVEQINKDAGAKDLPRTKPFDFAAYGFNSDGTVANPKQVLANQVARAYLNAKETGTNQELVDAVDMKRPQPEFKSKAQLDFTQIRPEFDNVMNQTNGNKVAAYTALVEKGYTPKRIKEAIGLYDFDETAFKQAQSQIAINTLDKIGTAFSDRQELIKQEINNNLGNVESIYEDLIAQGYSNLEIFTAARDMDFLSPQDLIDIFGAEYRQTVQNAINSKTQYPADFLDELETDARTLKVTQTASEITDVIRETGIGLVDSAVTIDMFLEYLKTNGFDQIAIALTNGVKQFAQDRGMFDKTADWVDMVNSGQVGNDMYSPEAINYAFSVSSELFSQAGRILQMARFFNEANTMGAIEKTLANNGVVLTEQQRKTLEALVNDYKTAQKDNKAKLEALQTDWSDNAYNAFWESEKAVGMATIRVAQFLEARKPIFWNERITSGAARGLLNLTTTVLSFTANIENNIYSTNFVTRTIQKLRDSLGSGIKANTLSISNWQMARKLTSKRMWFDMNKNAMYGVMDTSNGLNKYYDNLAQVNFFRDVKWVYNFSKTMVGKVLNKDWDSMTPEEQADAFDLTLVKLKDGNIELRDGKTYTFARSLAWTLGTGPVLAIARSNPWMLLNTGGPLLSEITGRAMAYGGDISFGYMAAQRAMIDYFQNIQGTRFQDGIFDSMFKDADGKLDENTIRAMSQILLADSELYARFEQEGLKRTLLGNNPVSGVISLGRGQLRKGIRKLYTENRVEIGGSNVWREARREFLSGKGLLKNTLQMVDVGLFTLMPFTKVPVNFLGSAITKVVPAIAMGKYAISEGTYQHKWKKFNEKYPVGKKLKNDKERRDYEKAKIDLFAAKRQATYDAAQVATSFAIYGFAMSAVQAGAILTDGGDDPEKEKALKTYGLRGGLYNASLHWEYIKAGMPANFIARRGGYVKEGDKIINTRNAGFLGYAFNLYGSTYDAQRKQEADNVTSLFNTQKGALSMLLSTSLSSGIEDLPMFQGVARIGQLLTDLKNPDATKNAWNNFAAGTLSTSMGVFFPSFFSFMSKGNAEMVQSANEINTRAENPGWPVFWGDVTLRVAQKLNRNVSFNEQTRNEFYEAAVGPFGEDLSYKVTLAEPGTAAAYFQAMLDPFGLRKFSSPAKEQQKEMQIYRQSMGVYGGLINLSLMYSQMTGQDYEWTATGPTSGMFGIITNPMKNKLVWTQESTLGGADAPNVYKGFTYQLPNDLYRQELKIRGERFRSALEKYGADTKDVIAKVQTAVNENRMEDAKAEIVNLFSRYQNDLTQTQTSYMEDYRNNREKGYLRTIKQRGLLTPQEIQEMIKVGLADQNGLID